METEDIPRQEETLMLALITEVLEGLVITLMVIEDTLQLEETLILNQIVVTPPLGEMETLQLEDHHQ